MTKNNFIWRIISLAALLLVGPALAWAGAIDPTNHYAYGNKIGLVDFSAVKVDDAGLTGYALVGLDRIDFNTGEFSVKNDGQGRLSGFASSAKYGIINFNGVTIDKDGYFQNVADGGAVTGLLIFDCTRNVFCPDGSAYKLRTDWYPGQAVAPAVAPIVAPAVVTPAVTPVVAPVVVPVAVAAPTVNPVGGDATAVSYKTCDKINDYINYVKCISDIDAQRSGTKVTVTNELLPGDAKDFAVIINNGASLTASRQVKLGIKASSAAVQMALASDNAFTSPVKEIVTASKAYELADTQDVMQTIYIKFYDKAGKPLYIASASITYSKPKLDEAQLKKATAAFAKLYGRQPLASANDQAALNAIILGTDKNMARDLAKEAAALKQFQKVYRKNPSGEDWNQVKAYAYYNDQAETAAATQTPAATDASAAVDCKPKKALSSALTVGSTGAEVKELQAILQCLGYLASGDYKSGSFDIKTEDAVKAFQAINGLKCADGSYCGFVGPSSRKVLNGASAKRSDASTVTVSAAPVETAAPVKAEAKPVAAVKVFTRNLTVQMSGNDVKVLQKLLASDGTYAGTASGTFDDTTEQAVKKYQEKNNLKCADGTYCGYIGPATRTKLEAWQAQQ